MTATQLAERPALWELYRLPAQQQPQWSDRTERDEAVRLLADADPLVGPDEVDRLRERLAAAGAGRAFVLQAGDCAESFADGPAEALAKAATLVGLAEHLERVVERPVVAVARIAGQYAKPRSAPVESSGQVHLPAFRGHIVNGEQATLHPRQHDARRLVAAYRHAAETTSTLRAAGWLDRMWTSHEALVLDYELPLTRPLGDRWLLGSTHLPWVGARTNQPGHAHIALAGRVVNPVGCKVTAQMAPETLLDLCRRLNPDRIPGRLVLISRMGVREVDRALPPLLHAVARAGHEVTWVCDPMHGNTVTTPAGLKTRHFGDIAEEVDGFLRAHRAAGTVAGGIHLELAAGPVTECLGGPGPQHERNLLEHYTSLCDPRLNPVQAGALIEGIGGS